MNPLQTKIQTSVGMETPQETLARAQAMTTPTTGTFSVKVPNAVPSTALTQGSTIADVRNTRNQMEQSQLQQNQLGTDYNTLQSSINAPIQGTPISNPDAYINQLLLSRPTETQNQLDQAGQNQANAAQGFANDYTKTVNTANEQFGVPQMQANLAETRKQIADRTVQLRNDLRQFEVNAKERGVAREYVNDAKQKVQADAAAQLADLSIIENAQVGNIAQANAEIDRLLQNKRTAYELQNNAMEAEIKRLTAMDTREGDQRAKQLTVALQERQRNIETQLANEKETRQYMMEAAANGADHGTLAAIQNAKTPGEALLAAGSWVGRLDRQLKIAQTNSANRANQPTTQTIPTINGKPQTAAQAQINSYANRLIESNKIVAASGMSFAQPKALFGSMLPNILQTPERQQFEQAKRDFATAVLRRESGAVISPSEFDTVDKQYFPQAGDDGTTVAQKANNRNTVINNFFHEANVPRPVQPGDIIESGGKNYKVEADGETLTEI
jgi:hypothetical protein